MPGHISVQQHPFQWKQSVEYSCLLFNSPYCIIMSPLRNHENYTQHTHTCLPSSSRICTVALSTGMLKLVLVPLLRSLPKNCFVPSMTLSSWIAIWTTVDSDWGGKLTGTAFACVIFMKSSAPVAKDGQAMEELQQYLTLYQDFSCVCVCVTEVGCLWSGTRLVIRDLCTY